MHGYNLQTAMSPLPYRFDTGNGTHEGFGSAQAVWYKQHKQSEHFKQYERSEQYKQCRQSEQYKQFEQPRCGCMMRGDS